MAAESALEVDLMLKAENRELLHSATEVRPEDDSLMPRPIALTLLAFGSEHAHTNRVRGALDGLAHLAGAKMQLDEHTNVTGASVMRMSVFTGVDAEWYYRQVARETVEEKLPITPAPGTVELCVRWAVAGATAFRTEFQRLPCGFPPEKSLEHIQNCLLSMKVSYDAPVPSAIAEVHVRVPNDAWARSLNVASTEFFKLQEGEPCVQRCQLLRENEREVAIESMNVFVRICPRFGMDPHTGQWAPLPVEVAVNRADAFHAFVVGNAAWKEDIVQYCKAHERTGLPMPDSDSAAFCLHTCGVQANGFCMGNSVSLYATHHLSGGRTPGIAISPPRSWVWRMEAAIVDIAHVLQQFYVVPCSRQSVMPKDPKLERPFNDFFNRAYKLYYDTFAGNVTEQSSRDDFEQLSLCSPSVECDGRDASGLRAEENYALTAFNLDATSRRITAGDAYSALQRSGAPSQLTRLMLNASIRYGINTSVIDVLARAADVIEKRPLILACEQRVDEFKRIADAALGVNAKRQRVLSPPVPSELPHLKSFLHSIGLQKGVDAMFPKEQDAKANEYSSLVAAIASCTLNTGIVETDVHVHACEVAARIRPKQGELTVISSVITILRSSPDAVKGSVFIIGQTSNKGELSFSRVDYGGEFSVTTAGTIMDTPVKVVLFLRTTTSGTKITATAKL